MSKNASKSTITWVLTVLIPLLVIVIVSVVVGMLCIYYSVRLKSIEDQLTNSDIINKNYITKEDFDTFVGQFSIYASIFTASFSVLGIGAVLTNAFAFRKDVENIKGQCENLILDNTAELSEIYAKSYLLMSDKSAKYITTLFNDNNTSVDKYDYYWFTQKYIEAYSNFEKEIDYEESLDKIHNILEKIKENHYHESLIVFGVNSFWLAFKLFKRVDKSSLKNKISELFDGFCRDMIKKLKTDSQEKFDSYAHVMLYLALKIADVKTYDIEDFLKRISAVLKDESYIEIIKKLLSTSKNIKEIRESQTSSGIDKVVDNLFQIKEEIESYFNRHKKYISLKDEYLKKYVERYKLVLYYLKEEDKISKLNHLIEVMCELHMRNPNVISYLRLLTELLSESTEAKDKRRWKFYLDLTYAIKPQHPLINADIGRYYLIYGSSSEASPYLSYAKQRVTNNSTSVKNSILCAYAMVDDSYLSEAIDKIIISGDSDNVFNYMRLARACIQYKERGLLKKITEKYEEIFKDKLYSIDSDLKKVQNVFLKISDALTVPGSLNWKILNELTQQYA